MTINKNIHWRTNAKYNGTPNPKKSNYFVLDERGTNFFWIWWKQQVQNYKLCSPAVPILEARPCYFAWSQSGFRYFEIGWSGCRIGGCGWVTFIILYRQIQRIKSKYFLFSIFKLRICDL